MRNIFNCLIELFFPGLIPRKFRIYEVDNIPNKINIFGSRPYCWRLLQFKTERSIVFLNVDNLSSPAVPEVSRSTIESIAPTQTASDSVESTVSVMECPAGEEPDGSGGCAECQSGFYKSQSGNDHCTQCPRNTDTNGQTGSSECCEYELTKYITDLRHKELLPS